MKNPLFPFNIMKASNSFVVALKTEKVKLAACGRNHTIVYTSEYLVVLVHLVLRTHSLQGNKLTLS